MPTPEEIANELRNLQESVRADLNTITSTAQHAVTMTQELNSLIAQVEALSGSGNGGGTEEPPTPERRAVQKIDVQVLSDNQVKLSWTEPLEPSFTGFVVARDGNDIGQNDGRGWSTVDDVTARSRVFDKLMADTEYTFSVRPVYTTEPSGAVKSLTAKTKAGSSSEGGGGGTVPTPTGKMFLGSAGNVVASGQMDKWLGKPIPIGGTWNDARWGFQNAGTIAPKGVWNAWVRAGKPLDIAVGGVWVKEGMSWSQAGAGAYNSMWRDALLAHKAAYAGASMKYAYIRFCHEFNLDGNPYFVRQSDVSAFKRAWGHFRSVAKEAVPEAKLVWCPNYGTSASLGLNNILDFVPESNDYDVMAIDAYNSWPFRMGSDADLQAFLMRKDGNHIVGPELWRREAEKRGKPFAIGEYSSSAKTGDQGGGGDAPEFMRKYLQWMVDHATNPDNPQAGGIIYSVLFNLWDDQFAIYPNTRMPNTRDAWKKFVAAYL